MASVPPALGAEMGRGADPAPALPGMRVSGASRRSAGLLRGHRRRDRHYLPAMCAVRCGLPGE